METHTKFADTIYFRSGDALYVNLFIPSEVAWAERRGQGRLETRYPEGDTHPAHRDPGRRQFALKAADPGLVGRRAGTRLVRVNGRWAAPAGSGTYATIDRHWRAGDTVELAFP